MTRFSFVGVSGWRSQRGNQEEFLLSPERLERRFELFEKITVPSLRAQTDKGFDWVILASKMMPESFQNRLKEIVDTVPNSGFSVVALRPKKSVSVVFRRIIQNRYEPEEIVNSVVLDDDDAVSDDFVDLCKSTSQTAWSEKAPEDRFVISTFAYGYSLVLNDTGYNLVSRDVPFTNLGLTMTAPATERKNLFAMSHKRIGERHPNYISPERRPVYLRTVHDTNDSRALVRGTTDPDMEKIARERFSQVAFDTLSL